MSKRNKQANTTSDYPWIGMSTQTCSNGCSSAANRASQYTWSDGTPFDYENPSFTLNDDAPNYGHYYRTGTWGTWCESCESEGICQYDDDHAEDAIQRLCEGSNQPEEGARPSQPATHHLP